MKMLVVAAGIAVGLAFGSSAEAQTKPTVTVIVKDMTSPHWQAVLAGARQAGQDLGVNVVEHESGLPYGVGRHADHDRGADEKQDAGGLIGVPAFEKVAETAAEREGRDKRERHEDVPYRADLTGHRMLLAHHRGQSVLSARDE